MKNFILGISIVIFCTFGLVFAQDDNLFQSNIHKLKFIAKEAAAAAGQYYIDSEYAEGRVVFNRTEGIKAAEYIIKQQLKLDNSFNPLNNSYWRDHVTYQILFFDDSNTTYPTLYTDPDNSFTLAIGDPTVVVRINAGQGRYRTLSFQPRGIRTAAYEWKSR